jgi:hypothetical protein
MIDPQDKKRMIEIAERFDQLALRALELIQNQPPQSN